MNALNVRAQSAGLDLRPFNNQQRNYLAQMPLEDQTQRILDLLRLQNPQRHAAMQARMQARAASTRAVQGSAAGEQDGEDSDDEDDDDNDDDESSED